MPRFRRASARALAGAVRASADGGPTHDEQRIQVSLDPVAARRVIVVGLVLVTIWLAGLWVFGMVSHFLFLLLLAWLLAAAMEPAIGWLLRHGRRRGTATAITGLAGIAGAVALTVLFGNAFIQQLVAFVQSLPQLVTEAVDWVNSAFHLDLDASQITDSFGLSPSDVAHAAENVAGGLLGAVGSLLSVVFDLFTVVVFAFYFASSGPKLLEALAVWLPPARQRVAGTVWQITAAKTGGYVVSKVALAALSAMFHGVFFWLIGLPSWLPMALLVGITAQFVPMIGTYIGVAIPVLVSLFTDPIDALWIIIFATIYQQIETYWFTPVVSRRTMDVHPAVALSAVFVGAAVWGPIGAIIGIPLAAAVVAVLQTYGRRYEIAADVRAAEVDASGRAAAHT
jgi:predicted PurR-regulated permease PerM